MPWFKVDDNLAFHSKTVSSGNAAIGLWVRCGSWSAQTLTEGFVPDHMVTAFGGGKLAPSLVASGLWDRVDGGYRFHDWDKYQPSRETVEADREAARERQRRARQRAQEARNKPRETSTPSQESLSDDQERHAVSHGVTPSGVTVPPTRPDPTRPDPSSKERPRRIAEQLPDGWVPSQESRDVIVAECPNIDIAAQHRRFVDWAMANGKTMKNWDASWRNWMRNAPAFSGTTHTGSNISRKQQQTNELFDRMAARAQQVETERKAISQ